MREEIRSGRATRERKLAVCTGAASLAPGERAELLAILAGDADSLVAERAANALLVVPPESFLAGLALPDPAPQLFRYAGAELLEQPGIADALAKHPACPPEIVVRAAPAVSLRTALDLLDNLERLSAIPGLAAALAANPSLGAEQRHLLAELLKEDHDEAALAAALAEVEPDRAKRESLFQRLARMRVVERVQLALKGNREERLALIRDPCKVVQRAVLQSSKLSEAEVEGYAAMASLSDDILRVIAQNRAFVKNYTIVKNLIFNAKCPLDISLHLLPRLTAPDLKMLTMNRNVADTLRTMAFKLQRQRNEARKD